MMPEHDPQPDRGSVPEPEDARPDALGPPEETSRDSVVHMSDRRPPVPQDPAGDDHTVVDLRRGGSLPAVSPPVPSPPAVAPIPPSPPARLPPPVPPARERRSPELAASAPLPVAHPPAPLPPADMPAVPAPAPPRAALSHRVLRVAGPAVAALLIAAVVAGAAVLRSSASSADAARWDAVAAAAAERAGTVDQLWEAVLGSVAAGVGQPVVTADQLGEALGAASATNGVESPGDDLRDQQAAADDAVATFVDDVRVAVERTDGEPVELGNELESLAAARRVAAAASDELGDRASSLAAEARDRADAGRTTALVVLVVGALVAVLLAEVARRRLRRGLDVPVGDLQRVIDRVGTPAPPPAPAETGFPELTWLATDLRRHAVAAHEQSAQLRRRVEWGEQSQRIFEALELAEDEGSSYAVLERALAAIGGDRPVELLLAERGSTSLHTVAVNPAVSPPGCPVDSTVACVALRRGQVSVFDSSESINACPKLRDRPGGPCSAACVPVTVAGRPVGVLHTTAPDRTPPTGDVVEQLVGLATRTGTRFSALRTLESSRKEASTDGLTGLPNRRTLETQIGELFERDTPFVMVLADLDRFKLLNDNFGHEMGDRALQLFAGVLRDSVRANDVVARLGGEEFVLVYPNMSVEISLEAIERVRSALARALDGSPVPNFTCSFGIAHSTVGHDGDTVLRIADAGLLQAKDLGGDQAVVADAQLAATIFADGAPLRARRDEQR